MASVFFVLSKILSFLVSPVIWIVLLFIFSVTGKNILRKRKFFITALTLLITLTNPFLINVVMHQWEIPATSVSSITRQYDAGIVMGGSTRIFSGKLQRLVYSSSIDRVMQAVDLYKNKKIKKIILTGGSGLVMYPDMKEAGLLKNVLLQMCIPDSDIIIENESRNTHENAKFTAELLHSKKYGNSFLLITSAIHIRRSLACFQKQNIQMDVYPVDERSGFETISPESIVIPNAWALIGWDSLIHEWIGYISYKIMGYV